MFFVVIFPGQLYSAATVTHFRLAMSYCETETKVSPMQETFAEKGEGQNQLCDTENKKMLFTMRKNRHSDSWLNALIEKNEATILRMI